MCIIYIYIGTKALQYSEAYSKSQSDLDKLSTEYSLLQKQYIDLSKTHEDEITKFQSYKSGIEKESYECMVMAQKADDRAGTLKEKLAVKTDEYESICEVLRGLKHEYAATREDAEGMVQVMAGLERQVQYTCVYLCMYSISFI